MASTYVSQRSRIRNAVCHALTCNARPYLRDCSDCRPVVSVKCLLDSATGYLDENGEGDECCEAKIAIYTSDFAVDYRDNEPCGDATLNLIIEIYICECEDDEREVRLDEIEEAVVIRIQQKDVARHLKNRISGFRSQTIRDDETDRPMAMRRITVPLEIVVDHTPPHCPQDPVCLTIGIENTDPLCLKDCTENEDSECPPEKWGPCSEPEWEADHTDP